MVKGYTTLTLVSQYLGTISSGTTTLTADQQTQAATMIGAAEAYIDREANRAWIVPAITAERYDLKGRSINLLQAPVSSVSSVTYRTQAIGDTTLTLTAGTDYEVFDLTTGQINFMLGYVHRAAVVYVTYTPNRPVPADIQFAATMIVAHSMLLALNPDRLGLDRVQADERINIVYEAGATRLVVPDEAQRIIHGYRLPLFS